MEIEQTVVATIVGMAVLTYLTRVGGVWLAGRVAQPERLQVWLQPVPGAILAAIVAPAAVAAGWRGLIGVAVVVCLMVRWGNLLLAAGVGTALVALLRL